MKIVSMFSLVMLFLISASKIYVKADIFLIV